MRYWRLTWQLAILLGSLGLGSAQGETWHFALIGDTPYSEAERQELPKMLAAIDKAGAQLIVHVGDIKNGGSRCDNEVFADRLAVFQASQVPLVYVPGDNDWTDCHRSSNGAYLPEERLEKLRSLFWNTPYSLGMQPIYLERQPGNYPEHSRFRLGPALFVTLNVPGGDNNWGGPNAPSQEFRRRNPQVSHWLKDAFTLARREKLRGIVVLIQANPGFKHFRQGLGHRAYLPLLETLQQETERFPGQVVLVHGDTHQAQVDHPLQTPGEQVQKRFTRVESYGYPKMGWIAGKLDTDDPELFSFQRHPWTSKPLPSPQN